MDTKLVYNNNASKWLRLHPSSMSDFTARPMVFDACGRSLTGRSVLDLGCGEGYCARELMRRGADSCVGVDLSSEMIQAAQLQDKIDKHGISFYCQNVVDYIPSETFDICIAVFLFNYLSVDEMFRVMRNVYNSLNQNGEFIFTIPHPFFPFLNKDNTFPFYFDAIDKNYFTDVNLKFEGEIWKKDGEPLHVQCVHKTIESYFNGLSKAGFSTMPVFQELTVTEELAAEQPEFFSPLLHQPLHILFKVTK